MDALITAGSSIVGPCRCFTESRHLAEDDLVSISKQVRGFCSSVALRLFSFFVVLDQMFEVVSAFASAVGIRCPCSPHSSITPSVDILPCRTAGRPLPKTRRRGITFEGTSLSEGLVHGHRPFT